MYTLHKVYYTTEAGQDGQALIWWKPSDPVYTSELLKETQKLHPGAASVGAVSEVCIPPLPEGTDISILEELGRVYLAAISVDEDS